MSTINIHEKENRRSKLNRNYLDFFFGGGGGGIFPEDVLPEPDCVLLFETNYRILSVTTRLLLSTCRNARRQKTSKIGLHLYFSMVHKCLTH